MAGPVRIAILANGAQARREFATVGTSLNRLSRLAKGGLAAAGIYGLTSAVVGFGASAVRTEAQFSTSMRLIGAATGASAAELKKLNDQAIQLGQDTSFSASEAADAMLELAKAGLDTQTIYGGGVAGTLQLAAAGGTDLGTAATIASNALNAFSLGGKDMAAVAAALAGAANASSASVESLGQGLQQVGPGATNAGLSLQETVAALSAFDAAGIKGSDAGTSLKTMLSRLVPQTAKASEAMESLGLNFVKGNGEFESLATISQQLQDRLGGLSDAQRVAALNTVFGSDASRAATVLMREGADGVRKYTKAANDQAAAQKMAKARMEGTAGALERLSGTVETAKLRLGQELAPTVTAVADGLGDELVPTMESAIDGGKKLVGAVKPAVAALADLVPSGDSAGAVFNDVLIPALTELSDLVAGAAGFIDDLPGPIKTMGVEAAVAALILPRLAASVTGVTTSVGFNIARLKQLQAELTYTATRAQITSSLMSRLGGAARAAAGVGGMLALAEGAQSGNAAVSTLSTTLGAAAVGFSVGGPVGAAVGGLGGLFYKVASSMDDAAAAGRKTYRELAAIDPVDEAKTALQSLRDTLDQVTGAYTGATRAAVLQNLTENGLIATAAKYGISARSVVNAALGQQGAMKGLSPVVADLQRQMAELDSQQTDLARNPNNFDDVGFIKSAQDQYNALEKQKKAIAENLSELQQMPKQLRAMGKETRAAAAATNDYSGKLKGLPKLARTDIEANGVEFSARAIDDLRRRYDLTPKQVKTLVQAAGAGAATTEVQRLIDRIAALRDKTVTVRYNVVTPSGKGVPLPGGQDITPRELGRRSGNDLMAGLIASVIKGSEGVDAALSKLEALVRKRVTGKGDEKRENAILKALKKQQQALRANGKAQDKLNEKLESARESLKSLQDEAASYAEGIKQAFVETGNLVNLGKNDAGKVSLPKLLSELATKAQRATRFMQLLQQLTAAGLSKTSLDQLTQAGPDAALETAEAIASGGTTAIEQINALTGQIAAAGAGLGSQMASTFYDAGIQAATGLVAGLEGQAAALDKIAKKLANQMVQQIKDKLGIKSPSRVMRDIGVNAVRGLGDGLGQDTYVRRQSAALATATIDGYGTPALDTYVSRNDGRGGYLGVMKVEVTAEGTDQLRRGASYVADVEVWRGAGGRVTTKVGA